MSTKGKLTLLAALVVVLAGAALLGGTLTEGGGHGASAAPRALPDLASDPAVTTGSGLTDLSALERAVAQAPRNEKALTYLGYGYLQRWRETADASYLPRAAEALGRARRLAPSDPLVVTGLGSLALTRHEFRQALVLGRRARRLAPYSSGPYGIVGDALVELGRYREAFAAFEKMNALKPNVASYARIAYARELLGNVDGAVAAMQLAVEASTGEREAGAWSRVELAKLEIQRGRLPVAARLLHEALDLLPGYVQANEQLARVEAARGRLGPAIARARIASEAVPLPQVVSLLGDLYQRAGRTSAARGQVATVGAIDRILASNGIRTDLEAALYDADHRRGLSTLVARAKAARAQRPSIYGDDAVAWALARTGRCGEARAWSERSLRLGTRDALLFFHRAMIESCLGDRAVAAAWARRAIAAGPYFSVRWAPEAARLVS
jgi:tetratricopeptide (TPR) repeat protein